MQIVMNDKIPKWFTVFSQEKKKIFPGNRKKLPHLQDPLNLLPKIVLFNSNPNLSKKTSWTLLLGLENVNMKSFRNLNIPPNTWRINAIFLCKAGGAENPTNCHDYIVDIEK